MKELTDITLVLDCSTSMRPIWKGAIAGVNHMITQQQGDERAKLFSLLTFSGDISWRRRAEPMAEMRMLNDAEYPLTGGTRLWDAIGEATMFTDQRIRTHTDADRPDKVIVAIMTDGDENGSRVYTQKNVFDMIQYMTKNRGWQFMFMGGHANASESAKSIGIAKSNTRIFQANEESVWNTTKVMNEWITRYSKGSSFVMPPDETKAD